MRVLGILLFILGAGSFILHRFGMEFKLFSWVDQWGMQTGNYIRIGAIILGLLLIIFGGRRRRAV